jgi:hypothetical protein
LGVVDGSNDDEDESNHEAAAAAAGRHGDSWIRFRFRHYRGQISEIFIWFAELRKSGRHDDGTNEDVAFGGIELPLR